MLSAFAILAPIRINNVRKKEENNMKRSIISILVLFFVMTGVAIASEKCPSCGSGMIWTGETKFEWGQMFKEYRCPAQHSWWIKSGSSSSSGSNSLSTGPKCPTCGAGVIWTGETYTEWGKMWKVYRCPAGHQSVGKM